MTGVVSPAEQVPDVTRASARVVRRPELRVRSLLVGWTLAAAGLLTAALVLPGLRVDGVLGAFGVVAVIGVLNALVVPVVARIRLPLTILSGFMRCWSWTQRVLWIAADTISDSIVVDNVRLGPRRRSCRCRGDAGVPDRSRRQQRRHVLAARDRADGATLGQAGSHRQAWDRLRRDRRSRLSGAPTRASATATRRRWRAGLRPAHTVSSSGRRISRPRPAPARRESCSAPTTTSPPSAGSRRRPGR